MMGKRTQPLLEAGTVATGTTKRQTHVGIGQGTIIAHSLQSARVHARLLLSSGSSFTSQLCMSTNNTIRSQSIVHLNLSFGASALPFAPERTSMCNTANAVILQLNWLTSASVQHCGV